MSFLSPARKRLCSRENAERVAYRIFKETGDDMRVVCRTDELQPYKAELTTSLPNGEFALIAVIEIRL
jgi:hypothetical protein